MSLSRKQTSIFHQIVYDFYKEHGRHALPWRTTHTTPYHILVSEIMLQQTQVERVIPKFLDFCIQFPTVKDLAQARQASVIRAWSGLGYNRRALNLQKAAQMILNEHKCIVPQTPKELTDLPGIGPYTAAAILAFAHNQPTLVIETNIRTVYIHHFFPNQAEPVHDTSLIPLIGQTTDLKNPRQWYAALMDYGAHLKAKYGNLTRLSKAYSRQSKFTGSDRQLRGAILKSLTAESPQPTLSITKVMIDTYTTNQQKVDEVLRQLEIEKFITIQKSQIELL